MPYQTVPTLNTGDKLTAAWVQAVSGDLNALVGAPQNFLTNGGCKIWQRGDGPFTANAAFTADGWKISLGGTSTVSVTRDNTTVVGGGLGGQNSLKCVYTHGGTGSAGGIQNPLNDFAVLLRGVTLTASLMVKSDQPVELAIADSGGSSVSTAHTGDNTWQQLTVTRTIAVSTTGLNIQATNRTASGTFFLDQGMLVIGTTAASWHPEHPAVDLIRCQRYYQKVLASVRGPASASGQWFSNHINFPVQMAITPTITITAGQRNLNNGSVAQNASSTGVRAEIQSTGSGDCYAINEIYSCESNP